MRGTIDLQSELGKGTTFTVTIPLEIVSEISENQDELTDADLSLKRQISIQEEYLKLFSNYNLSPSTQVQNAPILIAGMFVHFSYYSNTSK